MPESDTPSWRPAQVASVVALALAGAAAAHRAQFGSATYRASPLIQLELILVVLLALLLLAQPIVAVVHLVRKRPHALRVVAATLLLGIAGLLLAFSIDPATLLYAT